VGEFKDGEKDGQGTLTLPSFSPSSNTNFSPLCKVKVP
jgi:hypothetical protein